jgi:ubiquinone/menaquinone biosynthesis C-methylase UbiE
VTAGDPEDRVAAAFDRMAARYDEQRAPDDAWWEVFDVTVAEGLGAATRVLDVGCGTGALAEAVAERLGARVWAVDASAAMIEQARRRSAPRAAYPRARADALPFRDGWFDACTMRLVVHALGASRPAALAESARVLAACGRLYVWTFPPEHFERFYLNPYLPSLPAVDLPRFPPPPQLADELIAAGYARVRTVALEQRARVERGRAASLLRGGYISTVHLLDPAEVDAAVRRLEVEQADGLPPLERVLRWRLLVAERADAA